MGFGGTLGPFKDEKLSSLFKNGPFDDLLNPLNPGFPCSVHRRRFKVVASSMHLTATFTKLWSILYNGNFDSRVEL